MDMLKLLMISTCGLVEGEAGKPPESGAPPEDRTSLSDTGDQGEFGAWFGFKAVGDPRNAKLRFFK